MIKLSSYSKVLNMGHRMLYDLFETGTLTIQEKIDGSQISFGRIGEEVLIRSKGAVIYPDAPPKMFRKAVYEIFRRKALLVDGWIYRGEYLEKPKHNVIKYNRVPSDYIILFDIQTGPQDFLLMPSVAIVAEDLGFEVPPYRILNGANTENVKKVILEMMEKESILGGTVVEGVVIKNYDSFGPDGKAKMGKMVNEQFREEHDQKVYKQTKKAILEQIIDRFRIDTRWEKAYQHLRDQDKILHKMNDVGSLIREVQRDIEEEEEDKIKNLLYNDARNFILRGVVKGLPEWYKEKLSKLVLSNGDNVKSATNE